MVRWRSYCAGRVFCSTPLPRLSTERLWVSAPQVAHRTWATVPCDRSRVGQRGSQSRGAQEKRGIGGGLFLGYLLLAGTKEGNLPRVSHPKVLVLRRPKGASSLDSRRCGNDELPSPQSSPAEGKMMMGSGVRRNDGKADRRRQLNQNYNLILPTTSTSPSSPIRPISNSPVATTSSASASMLGR